MLWHQINLWLMESRFFSCKNFTVSKVILQDSSPSRSNSDPNFSFLWWVFHHPWGRKREWEGCELALMLWPRNFCSWSNEQELVTYLPLIVRGLANIGDHMDIYWVENISATILFSLSYVPLVPLFNMFFYKSTTSFLCLLARHGGRAYHIIGKTKQIYFKKKTIQGSF